MLNPLSEQSLPEDHSSPPRCECTHGDSDIGAPNSSESDKIILDYLDEVRHVASSIGRRLPPRVQLEDMIQAGTLGLIDAVRRYDRSRQTKFRQYARIRIWGAIFDSLRELDWASRYMRTRQQKLEAISKALETSLGRRADSGELAEALGIDLDTFYELSAGVQEMRQIELDATSDEDERSISEELSSDPCQSPDAVFLATEMRDRLHEAISKLPKNERSVMELYYYKNWKMEKIARSIGRTESRISQIHANAVAHLRQRLGSATSSKCSDLHRNRSRVASSTGNRLN